MAPNPAIELTRSGRARLAFISFSAKPALPPRAAHGERWVSELEVFAGCW